MENALVVKNCKSCESDLKWCCGYLKENPNLVPGEIYGSRNDADKLRYTYETRKCDEIVGGKHKLPCRSEEEIGGKTHLYKRKKYLFCRNFPQN